MNAEAAKAFLRCLGVNQFNSRTGWVTSACPLGPWRHPDGSGKAAFGVSTGLRTVCKCFSCDYTGDPMDLVYEIRFWNGKLPSGAKYELGKAMTVIEDHPDMVTADPMMSVDEATYGAAVDCIFPEDWLAQFELAYCAKPTEGHNSGVVHPYLEGRKVPYLVAKELDLRFDAVKQRVCFPIRDYKGQLRGFHGRSIWPHVELRYLAYGYSETGLPQDEKRNPQIWLGEHWVDSERPVVLTESVFDLARVYQVYRNVMCPLYATPPKSKVERLKGVKTFVTLFDNDKAGKIGRAKIASFLPNSGFIHVDLPEGVKDAGELDPKAMESLLGTYLDLDKVLLP